MTYTKHVVKDGKNVIIEDQCDSDHITAIVDELLPKAESLISLSVLFRVWKENSISLREYRMKGLVDYAEGIKCILNYFNSIYAMKEFLEGNYSEKQNGRKEKEGSIYYNLDRRFLDTSSWIRFGCEYRNRLIHQTNVPRDFGASIGNYPGEWFICLEDFINIQKKKMKNKEDTYNSVSTGADTDATAKAITYNVDSNNAVVNCGASALTAATENHTTAQSKQVLFTNTLLQISPTGVITRYAPYALILIGGIALLIIAKKRKPAKDDEE